MDSITRTTLVAAALAARDANQIRVAEDNPIATPDLTPDKARSLLSTFGVQIRKYGNHLFPAPTPRIVTAQRPFWERYRYKQHNGTQEMARRQKRIYSGRMSLSECIRSVNGVRYTADSHGVTCRFYS